MTDLVEFLRARLDEDEVRAQQELDSWNRATERGPITEFPKWMVDPIVGPFSGQSRLRNVATGLYVGRIANPSRVLAEVEAKRCIIDLADEGCDGQGEYRRCAEMGDEILRLLALPYADHDDFDPMWK